MHHLVRKTWDYSCGYAPRVIHRRLRKNGDSELDDVLFVGCKDGSITILYRRAGGRTFKREILTFEEGARRPAGVRVIRDWGPRWLLVGRNDGTLETVHWRQAIPGGKAQRESLPPPGEIRLQTGLAGKESVRYATWLDDDRLVISYRDAGTFLVQTSGDDFNPATSPLAIKDARRLGREGGIRLLAPLAGSTAFLIIGPELHLYEWEPPSLQPQRIDETWHPAERPALLHDIAYVGHPKKDGFKQQDALILTTDTGVYAIDLRKQASKGRGWTWTPEPLRLALPGLTAVPMSATYVELGQTAHLWLADRQGDSHLFENMPLQKTSLRDWVLGFHHSGLVQTGSQSMIALGWGSRKTVWLAQACRNDRIKVERYRQMLEELGDRPDIFLLLSAGREQAPPRKLLQELRNFLDSAGEWEERSPRHSDEDEWPAYAVLAEVFEVLAEDEKTRDKLFEFLSNPRRPWVAEAMLRLCAESGDDQEVRSHLEAAIELWNLCLVGRVNRHSQPREQWYLGILRFFRGLTEACEEPPLADHREHLTQAIEKALRFARKWGLYGNVNAIRDNLVRPYKILHAQQQPDARLDELTYASLLFRRSHSEVLERTEREQGRRAWDLSKLSIEGGILLAVSWSRHGVEIRLLTGNSPGEAQWSLLDLKDVTGWPWSQEGELRGDAGLPPRQPGDQEFVKFDYSRAVLLLGTEDRVERQRPAVFHLLTANRRKCLAEELQLWRFELGGAAPGGEPRCRGSLVAQGLAESAGPDPTDLHDESVFRFLDLGSRYVAVGLKGHGGKARLAVVELPPVDGSAERLRLVDWCELAPKSGHLPHGAGSSRNPIWSLAAKADRRGGQISILAGCENGEIWQIPWRRQSGEGWKLCGPGLVGRLAAPVTALACRTLGDRLLRIFAGARDGTIACFQELGPQRAPFATLWVTREQAPICHLATHHYRGRGDQDFAMVMAVARSGVCVTVDDRVEMEVKPPTGGEPDRPHRHPFPGIRRFRVRMRDMRCFAASLLAPQGWSGGDSVGAWGYLATASSDGEMSLLSLHYLRYTHQRQERFEENLKLLWEIIAVGATPRRLRVIEAAYRSSSLLTLVPVRWLLDPDVETRAPDCGRELMAIEPWWFPRLLRPLRALWNAWPEPIRAESAKLVGHHLRHLLRNAWQHSDVDLFQELCTVALKRINYHIYRSGQVADPESLKLLYFAVFTAIEDSLQLWIGVPDQKETRVRIAVAKNLVDGDTFWRIIERLANAPAKAWEEILEQRIEGVRQLVFKGDWLVSLESLRAANHSLLRLCRRLADARKPASSTADPSVAPWALFRTYFFQLVHGAAQSLGPNPRLSDALFHEYARTFALCLYACPEGIVRMVNRLTEARLILDPFSEDDLSARIADQLHLLDKYFKLSADRVLPQKVVDLLLRPDPERLMLVSELEEAIRGGSEGWAAAPLAGIRADLSQLDQAYGIVRWLQDLTKDLATDARELRLTATDLNDRLQPLDATLSTPSDEGAPPLLFEHSLDFWRTAIAKLAAQKDLPLQRSLRCIRPEMVLFSDSLARWAAHWIGELDERYKHHEIFQPQYRIFAEVLQQLERSAAVFALGASVQKNLVIGILGHHLLEDLDLHVLELREVARNLDPLGLQVEQPEEFQGMRDRETKEPAASIEGQFANLLLRRAGRAQSLPKNLRVLAQVLGAPSGHASSRSGDAPPHTIPLGTLIGRFAAPQRKNGWRSFLSSKRGPYLQPHQAEFLTLVLRELHHNHLIHSGFDDSTTGVPQARWETSIGGLSLQFPVRGNENEDRWKELTRLRDLQEPCNPRADKEVASTGAGLYLSSLAAAMVGWRLTFELRRDPNCQDRGWCNFLLKPVRPKENGSLGRSAQQLQEAPAIHGHSVGKSSATLTHLVVIDDKPAFALYAWREAGRVAGFGAADASVEDAKKYFWSSGQPQPLLIPDRMTKVWWINATVKANWQDELMLVRRKIPAEAMCFFLVDVRGPAVSVEPPTYKIDNVVAKIKEGWPEAWPDRIRLISSYEQGTKRLQGFPFEILSKSPETFSRFIPDTKTSRSSTSSPNIIHILVTGAGFELREKPSELRPGLPATRDLLTTWIIDAYGTKPSPPIQGFPVPPSFPKEQFSDLWSAAEAGDLDIYWNALLSAESRNRSGNQSQIAHREYVLREKFRKQFLRYDWGHLDHVLIAAGLGWRAWLSTNYTRFADRAVQRVVQCTGVPGMTGCGDRRRPWRVIATREEAEQLRNEVLHALGETSQEDVLFKLHGDVSHVVSMAIAGKDKEISSLVQSFAPLYVAAEKYLQQFSRLPRRPRTTVVWHIIGHGLSDKLLVRLIQDSVRDGSARNQRHVLMVVNPVEHPDATLESGQRPSEILRKGFGLAIPSSGKPPDVVACSWEAEPYLALLRGFGLPRDKRSLAYLMERIVLPLG